MLKNWAAKAAAICIPTLLLAGLGAVVALHLASAPHASPRQHNHMPPPVQHIKPQTFLLGVFEHGTPGPWTPISRFAAMAGTPPKLVLIYTGWLQQFRYGFAKTAAAHGAVIIDQIQPWSISLSAIADGRYDRYLSSYARQVRIFHRPVIIGFAHEMNGGWYSWGKQPTAFRAAWRHIVTLFRQQGATNVTWMWTPNNANKNPSSLRRYWPGSKYVNWVGIDGYYYDPADRFRQIFRPSIRVVRKLTHAPILLSETAVGNLAGQARLIPDLFAGIRHYHLLGLIWFDVHQHHPPVHQDWRLEGHSDAVAAFRKELLDVAHIG